MSGTAHAAVPRRALRVLVIAADPVREAGLASIVRTAGHIVSADPNDAEIVLADGAEPESGLPVVALGEIHGSQPGMLPRDASPEQIDAAIHAVAAGLTVRPAEPRRPSFDAIPEPGPNLLTPREVEVLAAIGHGLSNKAIARQLGISQHTVKFHVESLMRKLDAASRAEAVHKGLRGHLIEM
jgi:two-component system, NarL family, nitrate/nitrite response regulator NarL